MAASQKRKVQLSSNEAISMIANMDSSGSEFDDSERDLNYHPNDEESSSDNSYIEVPIASKENIPIETEMIIEIETEKPVEKRKRNSHPKPEIWKKNVPKLKRLKGEYYKNRKGKEKPAKVIGHTCTSEKCKNSNLRRCQSLSEDQRLEIFNKFWSMSSWQERRSYAQALVHTIDTKQKTAINSRRQKSMFYHLKLPDGTLVPVCKFMFCSTLGISNRTVGMWISTEEKKAQEAPNNNPGTGKHRPVDESDRAFLTNWLASIPTVPSHYCRNIPSYSDKKFLFPGTTKANLHRDYEKAAEEASKRKLSAKFFSEVFDKEKYSIFIPRKDQCDICVAAKYGNIDESKHEDHIRAKDEARAEKVEDKDQVDETISVWTMDLQAVLLCPKTQASSMYYKTKLQVHNFTLYNLKTKDGFCYLWDETEGSLSSLVFAHLQYSHFEKFIKNNPEIKTIIIWSDGCGYQNRNATIANAYLDLSMRYNVTIIQKIFLVAGHTQMECDSMHSTIERKLLHCDIFNPHDYSIIMQTARINPAPYKVYYVTHDQILMLSGTFVTSIRTGKKVGDLSVHDLRALEYSNAGTIRYKVNFGLQVEWDCLPQRITIPPQPLTWIRMFTDRLLIKFRKFNDLQAMKPVLPQLSHHFYDSIPHELE